VAKKTYQKDIIALKSLSQFIPEYQQVSDIDTEIIKKWYLDKAKQTSATNANSLLRHISKFFTTAIKSRYIAQNPCQYVEKCKENEPIVKTLSQSEVKHLLDYFHDNDKELHTIPMIVLNTGIRVSELCRLKVNDISTENGTMIVRSENDRPTKSKKYRVVPIPQHALTFFKDLTNNRLQEELLLQWRSEWLSKKFVKKARQAGINCGLHDLRRTYGAWLVMAGCDLVTVQQNMGHSSIHVTVKHYAHISLNQRIEQTNKLPDVGKT
jgi:integrase